MKRSLNTLQNDLGRKDFETWKLTREVRQCQKQIWQLTLEERLEKKRVLDLLCEARLGPQALELSELCRASAQLSNAYADAKNDEMQTSLVAKRQRAFFAQAAQQEGLVILKRHPAGEVFMAEEQPHAAQQRLPSGRAAAGLACSATQYCNWEADEVIEDDEDDEDDDSDSLWESRSPIQSRLHSQQAGIHDEDRGAPKPPPRHGGCGGNQPGPPDVEPLQLCPTSSLDLGPPSSARSI
jgi:hypothetical protein